MPRFSIALPLASSIALALAAACSPSSSSGKTCNTYVAPASTDLTSPVSFKTDIVGNVFKNHCAFSGCHGDEQILFLAYPKDDTVHTTDPGVIITNIVNAPSKELPTMPYVTPGDPTNSYMMHKMDGDNCTFQAKCVNQDCIDTMPRGNDLLDVPTRDLLRRWIAQGAKND